MNSILKFVILQSINCCLGSFYFGYSIGYLNVTLIQINSVLNIDPDNSFVNGMIQALMPIGGGVGSYLCSLLLARFTKVRSLMITDVVGILGYLLQYELNLPLFVLGRLLTGIASGLNTVLVPIYIFEMTPNQLQAEIGCLNQILITLGILVSFMMGYFQEIINQYFNYLPFVFTFPILTCIIRIITLKYHFNNESPFEYIKDGRTGQLQQYFQKIYQKNDIDQMIYQIRAQLKYKEHMENQSKTETIFKKNTISGLVLASLSQICGINVIMLYSTKIFMQITNGNINTTANLNMVVALTGLISAIVISFILKYLGRYQILIAGYILCGISMVFLADFTKPNKETCEGCVIFFIFTYLLSFGLSIGPLTPVCLSEFLNMKAFSLANIVSWVWGILIAQFFPILADILEIWRTFLIFGLICLAGSITINKSLKKGHYEKIVTETKKNFDETAYLQEKIEEEL